MHLTARAFVRCTWICGALAAGPTFAAPTDTDALDLQGSVSEAATAQSKLKLALEAALGSAKQRNPASTESLRRFSADLVYATRVGAQGRFTFSDRVDNLHPSGGDSTVNSLRELYGGWQDESANWVIEFGRINLRQGPALGFNPTDFFRDGALRVATTVNPMLIREYRLGSAMLRAQRLWTDGSVSLAVSPKLEARPSESGWSPDWGATNNRNRALLSLGTQWSQQASAQLHLYAEDGGDGQLGASLSALQGEATVLYAEAAWGRDRHSAAQASGAGAPGDRRAARLATGFTYTTASKLSITTEFDYNGFAVDRAHWTNLAMTTPGVLGLYLAASDRIQDPASRKSLLLHAKQTDAFVRNLDLTAMLRANVRDHSMLAWAELRYHLKSVDLSVQWLRNRGRATSEYGLNPQRSAVQVLGTWYL